MREDEAAAVAAAEESTSSSSLSFATPEEPSSPIVMSTNTPTWINLPETKITADTPKPFNMVSPMQGGRRVSNRRLNQARSISITLPRDPDGPQPRVVVVSNHPPFSPIEEEPRTSPRFRFPPEQRVTTHRGRARERGRNRRRRF